MSQCRLYPNLTKPHEPTTEILKFVWVQIKPQATAGLSYYFFHHSGYLFVATTPINGPMDTFVSFPLFGGLDLDMNPCLFSNPIWKIQMGFTK